MTTQGYDKTYRGTAAENYQRYFVPHIGGPVAADLIEAARPEPGESVLDVACGTGVVTRLAAEMVGSRGSVTGLDVNPGMLAVARAETPSEMSVDWHEATAEAMPFADETFDVVLCQMSLQFIPDKAAALGEMRRVLKPGGRVYVTVPGPKPEVFRIMGEGFTRHLDPDAAGFVDLVFSMHDAGAIERLMRDAGFRQVEVRTRPKDLRLPAPQDFLWQYVHSTPMTNVAAAADRGTLEALERDVCQQWQAFTEDGALVTQVGMTTASGVR